MPRYPSLDVLGYSGLNQTGGIVYEEWLNRLSGDRAIRTYKEMRDNDAIIGAILYAIKALVRQVPWRVEENPSGHPQAQRAAEFLRECAFEDMSLTWEDLISEILSMFVFGYSAFEIVYKVRRVELVGVPMGFLRRAQVSVCVYPHRKGFAVPH